jgi:hypothetical protein
MQQNNVIENKSKVGDYLFVSNILFKPSKNFLKLKNAPCHYILDSNARLELC